MKMNNEQLKHSTLNKTTLNAQALYPIPLYLIPHSERRLFTGFILAAVIDW